MSLLGDIGKSVNSIVGECMREALGTIGKDVLNAQVKVMEDILKEFEADGFSRDMKVFLERNGINDKSVNTLPDLQLVNILNSSKSPMRDLHELLNITDHLFDNCKTVVETVKE